MSSPGGRVAVGVVALAVLVALFFVLRDSGDDEPSTPAETEQTTGGNDAGTNGDEGPDGAGDGQAGGDGPGGGRPEIPTIVVRGGEPVGGVAELSFTRGDRIRFAVRSDVADHVHLHGYDVMKDVRPGDRVTFNVPATIEGVFEVELEDRVVPLAEITVNPR